jgi:hypothetical protein
MDLSGALLISAVSCIVFGLIGLVIKGTINQPDFHAWAWYAWFSGSAVLASWSILGLSKTWEHREGDQWLRRLAMMSAGIVVGGLSFGLSQLLMTNDFASDPKLQIPSLPHILTWNSAWRLIVFFTFWLGFTRIWRLADPARRSRFGLWSVGLNWVLAVTFAGILNVDVILFGMLAVVVVLATQLAAPLMNEDRVETLNR